MISLSANHVRKSSLAPKPILQMLMLDTGHSALPESCPVCAHSPVTADDCIPHKSLRQTIKIWIKSQEKKREDRDRAANAAAAPKATAQVSQESIVTPRSTEQSADFAKADSFRGDQVSDRHENTESQQEEELSKVAQGSAEAQSTSQVCSL